jgi:hypothetical protein
MFKVKPPEVELEEERTGTKAPANGVTRFEGELEGLVPVAFVAVTVKV